MASDGKPKPYRVYRGGRASGKLQSARRKEPTATPAHGRRREKRARRTPRLHAPRSWKRLALLGLVMGVVFVIAWGVSGYLAFVRGVQAAEHRLGASARAALSHGSDFLLSDPTTILLLGVDAKAGDPPAGPADTVILVRTDPSHHLLAYLSIPRNLLITVPSAGEMRVDSAFQVGGAALAIKAVEAFTGVPINHVVIVDLESFTQVVDAAGGVTLDVPETIVSNRFACPYPTQAQCQAWKGWHFPAGVEHMDGKRALIYARLSANRLDPADNGLTRDGRAQQIIGALASQLASFSTLVSLPFDGGSLFRPLATDLSAAELLELGWIAFRASDSRALYCRLGGNPADVDEQSVLLPSEDNASTLTMWAGISAPLPPSGADAPGCVVGSPINAGS